MGSWWRSEEMTYVSIILSEEAAPACMRELGVLGCVQFSDLNPELTPFQRRFVSYIKRCEEIERKIRYLTNEVKRLEVPISPAGSVESFVENIANGEASSAYVLESLETKLEEHENNLLELNKYSAKLGMEYCAKVEYHHLLRKSKKLLGDASDSMGAKKKGSKKKGLRADDIDEETGIAMTPFTEGRTAGAVADEMSFANIAGTVASADRVRFERMLYRTTRGNCFVRFLPLDDSAKDAFGKPIDRVAFMIFFKSLAIESKVRRICDAFTATIHDMSMMNSPAALKEVETRNYSEMVDTKAILDKNTETRVRICLEVASQLEEWLWVVRREKGIYHSLNLFKNDVAGHLLRGRGWILKDSLNKARAALKRAQNSMNLVPTAMLEKVKEAWPEPPTHFITNKYTYAFQEFVNTYGIPRYREANPALFTAATFPFFFGVMYGDLGHGTLLMLGGLYLILTEKNITRGMDEMVSGLYSARFMIFAMGLMAMYAGLVYNDYFAVALDTQGTNYIFESEESGAQATRITDYGDPAGIVPFGVDPAWKLSGNELLFYNSMKMKMSVIMGIIQMMGGVGLRGINAKYFNNTIDLVCEVAPMVLFALSLFGYMVVLIFVKWSINWDERMALGTCGYDSAGNLGACSLEKSASCFNSVGDVCTSASTLAEVCPLDYGGTGDGCQPPNLITTLINIALAPGSVDEPMFAGQAGLQSFLLFCAFISVPWLLLAKPFYLRHLHQQEEASGNHHDKNPLLGGDEEAVAAPAAHGHGGHGHGGEFNFGEIFIHQAIETIEFVLGMVSNTASYLRLWALSLAHTELATVFWEKAMVSSINFNSPVAIFFGYAIFAGVTFGVLLAMDVLECFLHALRLHWVEFQNKFFRADGYRFDPFCFHKILDKAMLE